MRLDEARLDKRVIVCYKDNERQSVRGVIVGLLVRHLDPLVIVYLDSDCQGYLFTMNGSYTDQKKGYITHLVVHPDNLQPE